MDIQKYFQHSADAENAPTARNIDEQADSLIRGAAARAFGIGILPYGGPTLLMLNESHMFYRLAALYGRRTDEKMWTIFLGALGSEAARFLGDGVLHRSMRPPLYAAITYGFGRAAKVFFTSGMEMQNIDIVGEFQNGVRENHERK
ncbi:MAG: hypothetical protein MJ016_03550 [Victivallaceae bacterium]|nr:hypothetical protein [Victivallaceae bacterium]